jgi:hypothetical protein
MRRDQILDEAKKLICEDRVSDYGTPRENFTRIAKLWSVILEKDITLEQVALCMLAVKMTRLIQKNWHLDSWKDACGYAAIGGELSEKPATKHYTVELDEVESVSQWGLFNLGTF